MGLCRWNQRRWPSRARPTIVYGAERDCPVLELRPECEAATSVQPSLRLVYSMLRTPYLRGGRGTARHEMFWPRYYALNSVPGAVALTSSVQQADVAVSALARRFSC